MNGFEEKAEADEKENMMDRFTIAERAAKRMARNSIRAAAQKIKESTSASCDNAAEDAKSKAGKLEW